MEFRYNKQDLFIREKTAVALLGCFLVWATLGLPKPAILISAGVGLFALALVMLLEFTAMSYSKHSLCLYDNYLKITYKNIERDYYWTDLASVKEVNKGLFIKFRDGNMLSVLREICDYDLLRNMLFKKVKIATQQRFK